MVQQFKINITVRECLTDEKGECRSLTDEVQVELDSSLADLKDFVKDLIKDGVDFVNLGLSDDSSNACSSEEDSKDSPDE